MIRALNPDALLARTPVLWRALLAVAILGGLILAMVEQRARILRDGREVRLRTAPVDPRDLFRGDYVVLAYEIGQIDTVGPEGGGRFARGDSVHVRLGAGPDGFARVLGVTRRPPAAAPAETVIAGRVTWAGRCSDRGDGQGTCPPDGSRLRVAYGLESYFVPQGSGRAIERMERSRIEVVAAVSPSGQAAIKRLLVDGKPIHDEPPY